jgi:hypothetical protein
MRPIFLSCVLCINLAPVFCQEVEPALPSYRVCNRDPLLIRVVEPQNLTPRNEELELYNYDCFQNSAMEGLETVNLMRIKIEKSGTLAFAITPQHASEDIDFVVMQYFTDKGKQKKKVLRCMAAGSANLNSACAGATGLREGEKDMEEDAGCQEKGDNNWLKPIEAQRGDEYLILVANITNLDSKFRIEFTGTAAFECASAIK